MASFSYQEIFGNYVEIDSGDGYSTKIIVGTDSIRDTDNYGNLPVGVGLSSSNDPSATQMLYGILMLLKQSQGERIDTDPTQKVYITDAGKSVATGTRDGQIKRSFTVSFFIDAGLAGTPSLDQIDPAVS